MGHDGSRKVTHGPLCSQCSGSKTGVHNVALGVNRLTQQIGNGSTDLVETYFGVHGSNCINLQMFGKNGARDGLLYYTLYKYLPIAFPGHCIFLIAGKSKYPIVIYTERTKVFQHYVIHVYKPCHLSTKY